MLVLTVYESKGLEFEDVILYNFFTHGNIKSHLWKMLNEVSITKSEVPVFPERLANIDESILEANTP